MFIKEVETILDRHHTCRPVPFSLAIKVGQTYPHTVVVMETKDLKQRRDTVHYSSLLWNEQSSRE